MITLDVTEAVNPRLMEFLAAKVGPEWRRDLLGAAAASLAETVRAHLRGLSRHATAERLGATPTGFHAEGAARVTHSATPDEATVRVPVPGIARALRDVEIRPVRARALTIPLAAEAYARRAGELRRLGWTIFRPLKKGEKKGGERRDVLMGRPPGGGEAKPLYSLVTRVLQRRDPTLLPDARTVTRAVNSALTRAVKAGLAAGRKETA